MEKRLGMLMGISLLQKGSGFPFFAPCLYSYFISGKITSIANDINLVEVP